jgi:thioredoxin-related protein
LKSALLLPLLMSFVTVTLIGERSLAEEMRLEGWKTSHQEAWRAAQAQQRPMLMYITTSNCVYCRKMVQETLSEDHVAHDIQANFVPVSLTAQGNRLLVRRLRVQSYPTTVIISPRSVVLDYISGFVGPEEMHTRLTMAARKSPAVH